MCFVNAGTTEIPLVLAFDSVPGIRPVLCLFEGVCTGAADGYGRMLDKPAMTLLHLGPGLANGIANLHNARRAGTQVVNIIGEHATWHRAADPPLAMDIEGLAGTVSGWYKSCESSGELSRDLAEAVAKTGYGGISTLIVPNDLQWEPYREKKIASPVFSFEPVDSKRIDRAARLVKGHPGSALILGGRALREHGLRAAVRVKSVTGCDLLTDSLPPFLDRGTGLPDVARIPYFPEQAIEMLSRYDAVLLAGIPEPVAFFGYPGGPSTLLGREQKRLSIAGPGEDPREALECLAEALNAPPASKIPADLFPEPRRPSAPGGRLTPDNIGTAIAALQPENAIIVDEGLTTSSSLYPLSAGLPPHSYLSIAGGSIGYGMPCAVGASLACPERPVINLQADGSGMYTVQALWTQAREGLNITTLICSNRGYQILKTELARAGISSAGPGVSSLFDMDRPDIDWVKMATGMGVPAVSVRSADELAKELGRSISEPGPALIEMHIAAADS